MGAGVWGGGTMGQGSVWVELGCPSRGANVVQGQHFCREPILNRPNCPHQQTVRAHTHKTQVSGRSAQTLWALRRVCARTGIVKLAVVDA